MKNLRSEHVAIATVLQNLLKKHFAVNTADEQLVIDALRRSKNSLHDASLTELGDYVSDMSDEQLKGLANNIKGIYHELKYVQSVNSSSDHVAAEVFGETNHAGADVVLRNIETGKVIDEVQLKAADSVGYVSQHIVRYPEIDVMATSEVAERLDGVKSTGFSNAELTNAVTDQFDQTADLSTHAQLVDAVATSGLLSAAFRASEVISGKKQLGEAGKDALVDIGIAASTTAFVALLFG